MQANLIAPLDILQNGASSDFLDQFRVRPLVLQIVVAGALGTMQWQWGLVGDLDSGSNQVYSAPIQSEASPYVYTPADPSFVTATFAPGTYVLNDVYNVSSAGVVTGGSGTGIGLVTAVRFDVVQAACARVTSDAATWMLPRVVGPIISVGPQIVGWLCDIAKYRLKSRKGVTPPGAGAGDDNVRLAAEAAERNLKEIGLSKDRPPDLVDSSAGDAGAGLNAYPVSDPLRGW